FPPRPKRDDAHGISRHRGGKEVCQPLGPGEARVVGKAPGVASTRAVGPGEATGHEVTEFVKEREVVEFVRVYIAVAEVSEPVSGAVKGAGVPDVQPGPPLDRGPLVLAAGRIIEDEARLDLPHEVAAAPQDVEDVERSGTAVSVLSLETRHHLLPCLRV